MIKTLTLLLLSFYFVKVSAATDEKKLPEPVIQAVGSLFSSDKLCELQFNKQVDEKLTGLQSESPLTLYVWQNRLHLAQWDTNSTSFFVFDGKKSWLIQLPQALPQKKHIQWFKELPRNVYHLNQAKAQILDLFKRLKNIGKELPVHLESLNEGKILTQLKPQPPYIQDLTLEIHGTKLHQVSYKDDLENRIRLIFTASRCRPAEKKDQQWFRFRPKSDEAVTEL
ncbi:MAG: hypothetical protein N2Z70_03895 [Bdellovibrionaceae bacterium]|jgi:hypothetical protein|nr:hypothetical protein [Pseudobdellovibrionaceae bacterium]